MRAKVNIDLAFLGLSRRESEAYAELIIGGPDTLAGLAKRLASHRPSVSAALKKLQLVQAVMMRTQGKRAIFVATSPANLQSAFRQSVEATSEALVELSRANAKRTDSLQVRTIEGRSAMRQVFIDMIDSLKRDEVFYRYIACSGPLDIEPFVPAEYRPKRDAKNIQQYAISSAAMKGKPFKKGMGCLWKVVPPNEDAFEYGIAQLIYADTVVYLDYISETAVIICNERFAHYERAIHQTLYTRLSDRVT